MFPAIPFCGRDRNGFVSVYYDTPDQVLRKHGTTLRVRRVQGRFVQTVKREAGSNLSDRGEWETKIGGPKLDRAALAGTPAGDILARKAQISAPPGMPS